MPRNKKYVYICSPKRKVFPCGMYWRDAGVVDRAALEMRCTGNCTGSSNLFWDAKTRRLVRRSEGAFHKPPAFFTLRRMMQAGPLRSVIRASRMDALQMR